MAFPSSTVWEARSSGNSTANGAAFVPGLGGSSTDYSQADAPILTVSDGVTTSGSAVLTSATGGFTAAMVGNGLTIDQGGGTFTWYYITVFTNGNTVTLDKNSVGGSQTARNVRVGGGANLQNTGVPFNTFLVPGNKVWERGSFSHNTNVPTYSVSGSAVNPIVIEGYTATRGDGGFATHSSTTVDCFEVSGNFCLVKNIKGNAGNSTVRALKTTGWSCTWENCWAISALTSTGTGATRWLANGSNNRYYRCRSDGQSNAGWGYFITGTGNHFDHCEAYGSTELSGFNQAALAYGSRFTHCISRDNTGAASDGFTINDQIAHLVQCSISKNGRDGVRYVNPAASFEDSTLIANIFNRNGQTAGYEVNYATADISANTGEIEAALTGVRGNAFYVTGLGKSHFLPPFSGDVTLSADPFVDSGAGHDFTLNTTTGGGAVVMANPLAIAMPGGVGTDYLTLGALGAGSAPPPAAPSGLVATAVSGYRVDLSWTDNSTDELYFFVERQDNGGAFALIATVAANSTGTSDLTVRPGNVYTYRVRGAN
jgi:hypothetical protein